MYFISLNIKIPLARVYSPHNFQHSVLTIVNVSL